MFVKVAVVQVRLTCVVRALRCQLVRFREGTDFRGAEYGNWVGFYQRLCPICPPALFPFEFHHQGGSPYRTGEIPSRTGKIPCSSSDHAQLNSRNRRACSRVLGRMRFQRRVRPCSYRRTEARRDSGKTRKVYSTTLRCSV